MVAFPVIEEARDKSGSLITADYALEQGKTIFACPGRVGDSLSRGTNNLIKQGACILTSADDVLEHLGLIVDCLIPKVKKDISSLDYFEKLYYINMKIRNDDNLFSHSNIQLTLWWNLCEASSAGISLYIYNSESVA